MAHPPLPPFESPSSSAPDGGTAAPPAASGRRPRSFAFWAAVSAGLFALLLAAAVGLSWMLVSLATGGSGGPHALARLGGGSIGVIDVDGVILSPDTLVDQLRKFDGDASIRAILLHVDSPGGGAAASQEVYREVLRIREEKKKPIVAVIESVGASGAYYISSATGRIYANEASIVGSIGVISEWTNYGELLKWARLKPEILKAGALKDAGTPTRDLTPEERAYMQSLLDNMHAQFIRDVARGRHLPEQQVRAIASGRVWTGQQALPLHLIDRLGTFREALLGTAAEVGISGEPDVVKPRLPRRRLLDLINGDASDLFPGLFSPGSGLLARNANFYFLWR